MRTLLTSLAWLAAAGAAFGQATPYLATVTADNVSLRSAPGHTVEETGPLARGEVVIVLHDAGNDWLAVEPPRGQVSWVRTIKLQDIDAGNPKVTPRNAVVVADPDEAVAMGRPGLAAPLNVQKHRVPDGTVVTVIGANYFDNSAGRVGWTPIVPVKGECRYLPRAAVQFARGQTTEPFTVNSPPAPKPPAAGEPDTTPAGGTPRIPTLTVPAGASRPTSTAPAGKPADWPNGYPLWLQAEAASGRGEYGRAERLYLQLASDMSQPGGDVDLANLCYKRVHEVLEKQRAAGKPAKVEPNAATTRRNNGLEAAEPPAAKGGTAKWTTPGTVRVTGFKGEGLAKYSFRTAATGRVAAYLEAGPGVDFGQWREGEVVLYGTTRTVPEYGDVPLMTVTSIDRAGRANSRRD